MATRRGAGVTADSTADRLAASARSGRILAGGLALAAAASLVLVRAGNPDAVAPSEASICVPAQADSYVDIRRRADNFGTADTLMIEEQDGREIALVYVRFDVPAIPPGAELISATLELTQLWFEGDPAGLETELRVPDGPWEETRISYAARPAAIGSFDKVMLDAEGGPKTWDALVPLADWLSGDLPNNGLVVAALSETGSEGHQVAFASRETTGAPAPRLCVGWLETKPTETPADTATPMIDLTMTATATPSETATRRATEAPSRTPAATATDTPPTRATVSPSPTVVRPTPGAWRRLDDSVPLPVARARMARLTADGEVWLRVRSGDDEPDRIAALIGGRWRTFDDMRAAVASRYGAIASSGTVRDLWAVDERGRAWVGPAYFDSERWVKLADDSFGIGGRLVHEDRALLDRDGRAWVPYRSRRECAEPTGCNQAGLRVFDAAGDLSLGVTFEPAPEADIYGIAQVHLLPPSRIVARPTSAAEDTSPDPELPAQTGPAELASWVVARRALYELPSTEPIPYPLLGDVGGEARNAGYATAGTLAPDGWPQVFTWVEEHSERSIRWRILANTWRGEAGWDVWDLTEEAPHLSGSGGLDRAEHVRLTAAAYGPDGTLWLGSSEGELAAWRDGTWLLHFTPAEGVLPALPIIDLSVAPDGTVWIVMPGGLFAYGGPDPGPRPLERIWLPLARRDG